MNKKNIALFITIIFCLQNISSAQIPLKLSAGISAGGSGLAGIPLQLMLGRIAALDMGIYFRTAHVNEFEKRWFFGPSADVGINIFIKKAVNTSKMRTRESGIYLKGTYGLHIKEEYDLLRFQERSAGIGWIMETSNENQTGRFLQFQLGPSIIDKSEAFLNLRYPPGYQLQNSQRYSAMIYARMTWFFVLDR